MTALPVAVLFTRAVKVVDGVPLWPKVRALVDTGQEACAPVRSVPLWESTTKRVAHDNKCRKVTTGRAQPIGDP